MALLKAYTSPTFLPFHPMKLKATKGAININCPTYCVAFDRRIGHVHLGSWSILIRRVKKFSEIKDDWEVEYGPNRISYRNLFNATKGYNEKNLIGSGGLARFTRAPYQNQESRST
jgi:hypothetical protein